MTETGRIFAAVGRVVRRAYAGSGLTWGAISLPGAILAMACTAPGLAPPPAVPAHDADNTADSGYWAYEQLGPGLYASVTRPEYGYSRYANSLIVVGDSGVVVVDSRESPAAARGLIAYVRSVTDLPVLALVNSHWHWDHVNGNQAFLEAFPDMEILGHPEAAWLMREEGGARMRERIEELEARRTRLLRWLSAGARDDGRALSAEEVGQARDIAAADSVKIAQYSEVETTPPTRAVADSVIVDLGGRTILVLHPGPAHTPGDLVVIVPDARLAFAGDMIEYGPPWFGDGTVVGSRDALRRLAGRGLEHVLPAHGPTDVGSALFEAQLALLEDVTRRAAELSPGADPAAVARVLAASHPDALPGFEGPDDPRLLEYLTELIGAANGG